MKVILFLILNLLCSAGFCQTQFLHVDENRLVNGSGNNLKLNGVNLGCWMLWEGWMWSGGFTKESDLKKRLQNVTGENTYQSFLQSYYNNFITEKDIQRIAEYSFNCVRVPFNYRLFDSSASINGYYLIDNLITWCRKYKVYIILDMHAAPGGQNNFFISDNSKESLWESENNQQKTLVLWKQIANRYKNETTIAGYDLLNEPKLNNTQALLDFYNQLIKNIREEDSNHILIIEGNDLAHSFKNFSSFPDKNIAYSFHYYTWFAEGKKENNLQAIIKDIPANAPFFCGEWGEDTKENLSGINTLLKNLQGNCGSLFWSWKRTSKNTHLPVYTISTSSEWMRFVKYLSFPLNKPEEKIVSKALDDFVNAIKFDNCVLNEGTLNAITSQQ